MTTKTGIERACEALIPEDRRATHKGVETLAEALDITPQAVSHWVKQGYVPWDRARAISNLTGVPAKELVSPAIRELFA